jgi:hypothetical protein
MGPGTINAAGLYIDGVAVGSSFDSILTAGFELLVDGDGNVVTE